MVILTVIILCGTIGYAKRKTITVAIDGKKMNFITYKSTVEDIIKSKNITLKTKDKIQPSLNAKVGNKDIITITRAIGVKVLVDGKKLNIQSAEKDISSLLKEEKIALRDTDRVKPSKNQKLTNGMTIQITRVNIKTFTKNIIINFRQVVKKDSRLLNTKRRVLQIGKNGLKKVTYRIVYENGKETSRKIVKEVIVKKSMNRLIAQGTRAYMPVSRGGSILSYGRAFVARATAYWAIRGIGRTYTASGRKAIRDPEGYSTVAVDPSIIPFGTKIFIENYGFAVAADCGSGIRGNEIDVYFDTKREACDWAVKHVKVYILN